MWEAGKTSPFVVDKSSRHLSWSTLGYDDVWAEEVGWLL
jgi:hypothetical protein